MLSTVITTRSHHFQNWEDFHLDNTLGQVKQSCHFLIIIKFGYQCPVSIRNALPYLLQKRARFFLWEIFLIASVDRKKGNSEKPTGLGILSHTQK